MSLDKNNKRPNNSKLMRKFEEEMILYQKLYNLKLITKNVKVTKEYFDYCKTKRNFIILVLYDKNGRVYLKESGINQFTFLGGEVVQNDSVREAVKKVVCRLSEKVTIEELEPIAISKNVFENNAKTIEHLGLVVIARIDLKSDSKMEENFYYANETIFESISKFSDKKILKMFIKRFSNIVLYNNYEFQDEEIEVNKKYKSRYQFHNEIIKKNRYLIQS